MDLIKPTTCPMSSCKCDASSHKYHSKLSVGLSQPVNESLGVIDLRNGFFVRGIRIDQTIVSLINDCLEECFDQLQLHFSIAPHQPVLYSLLQVIGEIVGHQQQERLVLRKPGYCRLFVDCC